jgi:cystathionine beta-lyase/cystathionine gamma-synthase
MMQTTILVIWWIGLVAALFGTVVILKQVSVILRTLRHIHELAEHTRAAARGLADHLEAAPKLAELHHPAVRLRDATRATATAADAVSRRLDTAAYGPRPGG